MAKVICVTNQKGGVGKTTTAVNLGFFLAKERNRVLIVDFDPQGNASSGLGINKDKLMNTMTEVMLGLVDMRDIVKGTKFKNLDIAPTTPQLANTEVELAKSQKRFTILREAINEVEVDYDYIIIDCPPSLGLLTLNALAAANGIVIPIQCEYFALEGVSALLNTIERAKHSINPGLMIDGVVLTMFDGRTNLCIQVVSQVKKHFKSKVFTSMIPRNVRLGEAPSHGLPINLYDKRCAGAEAYKALAKELILRNR